MNIGQYTYCYGQAVAILVDQMIRFGNVEKVITQLGKDGETTAVQVIIEKPNAQNADVMDEPERFLVARANLIESLGYIGNGALSRLIKESEDYTRAVAFQDRVDNPPPKVEAAPPPPAAYERHEDVAGAQAPAEDGPGSGGPSPDEGADDVPL